MENSPVSSYETQSASSAEEKGSQRRHLCRSASPQDEIALSLRTRIRSRSPQKPKQNPRQLPTFSQITQPQIQHIQIEAPKEDRLPGPARLQWVYPNASESCSICGQPYTFPNHRAVRSDDCRHVFAWSCLESWFDTPTKNHNRCPVCRKRLFGYWDRDDEGNLTRSMAEQEMETGRGLVQIGDQRSVRPARQQSPALILLTSEVTGD